MADLEQVERLIRSIEEWNHWRQNRPSIGANLYRADLSGADLRYANLRYANLIEANLSRADLSRADLYGAYLSNIDNNIAPHAASLYKANLSGAQLEGTYMSDVRLEMANLSNANLNGASLVNTNLIHAFLENADLSNAAIGRTSFIGVDLRRVKGLTMLRHIRESYVELSSIQLPQDGSALHFLRGVGTPDEWIDFYRASMMHPIQYYSLFISYAHEDEALAHRLHADLQDKGVRCWFAPHNLKPGSYIRKEIDQAIHMQDKLLLILSEHAVNSGWVDHEVELALSREIRQQREILFPIRIDNVVLPSTSHWATTLQATRQISDFMNWTDPQAYQQIFDRLLRDLKRADV